MTNRDISRSLEVNGEGWIVLGLLQKIFGGLLFIGG
jgi:hypothetical protein